MINQLFDKPLKMSFTIFLAVAGVGCDGGDDSAADSLAGEEGSESGQEESTGANPVSLDAEAGRRNVGTDQLYLGADPQRQLCPEAFTCYTGPGCTGEIDRLAGYYPPGWEDGVDTVMPHYPHFCPERSKTYCRGDRVCKQTQSESYPGPL